MNAAFFKQKYQNMQIPPPRLHVVLGSGYGKNPSSLLKTECPSLSESWEFRGEILFSELEGLKNPSVEGHSGIYSYFLNKKAKFSLCLQFGRLHGYEGLKPKDVVKPLIGPYQAGTFFFLLTNAAGALNTKFSLGSVMIFKDHVNFTGKNPLYGPNPTDEYGKPLGSRFPDLTETYNFEFSEKLKASLKKQNLEVHEGVYLGLSGPSLETPAEIQIFRRCGIHAVGMSTVWEAIALGYIKVKLAALSLITNFGSGLNPKKEENSLLLNKQKNPHKHNKEGKAKNKKNLFSSKKTVSHKDILENFQESSRKILLACFDLTTKI